MSIPYLISLGWCSYSIAFLRLNTIVYYKSNVNNDDDQTPASSNCVTYSSQALYAGEGTVTTSSSGTSTGNGSSTPTGSGATTKSTGSSSSSAAKSKSTTSQSGAVKVQVSAGGAGIGVLVGVMFVAGLGGLVAVL
jgi:cobalamin biosynthesis Mg chelatase CobN